MKVGNTQTTGMHVCLFYVIDTSSTGSRSLVIACLPCHRDLGLSRLVFHSNVGIRKPEALRCCHWLDAARGRRRPRGAGGPACVCVECLFLKIPSRAPYYTARLQVAGLLPVTVQPRAPRPSP